MRVKVRTVEAVVDFAHVERDEGGTTLYLRRLMSTRRAIACARVLLTDAERVEVLRHFATDVPHDDLVPFVCESWLSPILTEAGGGG